MGHFVWQDLLAIAAALIGALQSARRIPDFPDDNGYAKFALGLHITVVVAIFSTMANPSVSILSNVEWVQNKFGFAIPLLGYALIIALGMSLTINSVFQTILIKVHDNSYFLVPVTLIMASFDIFILTHMMFIF